MEIYFSNKENLYNQLKNMMKQ